MGNYCKYLYVCSSSTSNNDETCKLRHLSQLSWPLSERAPQTTGSSILTFPIFCIRQDWPLFSLSLTLIDTLSRFLNQEYLPLPLPQSTPQKTLVYKKIIKNTSKRCPKLEKCKFPQTSQNHLNHKEKRSFSRLNPYDPNIHPSSKKIAKNRHKNAVLSPPKKIRLGEKQQRDGIYHISLISRIKKD